MVAHLITLALHPQTLRLAAKAGPPLLRAIPKAQLAKLGLARLSTHAAVPFLGGAVTGLAFSVLMVPQSRKWLLDRGRQAAKWSRALVTPADPMVQPAEPLVQDLDVSETSPVSSTNGTAVTDDRSASDHVAPVT